MMSKRKFPEPLLSPPASAEAPPKRFPNTPNLLLLEFSSVSEMSMSSPSSSSWEASDLSSAN